jgi:hypothetical protein
MGRLVESPPDRSLHEWYDRERVSAREEGPNKKLTTARVHDCLTPGDPNRDLAAAPLCIPCSSPATEVPAFHFRISASRRRAATGGATLASFLNNALRQLPPRQSAAPVGSSFSFLAGHQPPLDLLICL